MGLFVEGWNVAFRNKSCGSILEDLKTEFVVIPNRWYGWCADPFVFEYQNQTYIFAELFDYIKGYAGIAYCVLKDNKFSKWKVVIKESFHMSYPHVFEQDGEIYMLPETSGNKSLILYKAKRFPDIWEREEVLVSGLKIVDTTIDNPNLRGSLGLTYKINDNSKWELLLFQLIDKKVIFSDLASLSTDDSIARPGGCFFEYQGKKFRVSQDCEKGYGYALNFMEIIDFSKTSFKERKVKYISPEDISINKQILVTGVHTYNANCSYEVIDIKHVDYSVVYFVFRIINKIKRVMKCG